MREQKQSHVVAITQLLTKTQFGENVTVNSGALICVLQERKVRPVGSEDSKEITISGEKLQKEGFTEDLCSLFLTPINGGSVSLLC